MNPDLEKGRLAQARAGSADAFADLVRLHQASVRAFLGRFVRSRDVADDLAQETFLSAFRTLDSYRGESPLRHWLLGIARHRGLEHLRAEAGRRSRPLEGTILETLVRRLEEADDPAAQEERVIALKSCIGSLAPASREMVREFYYRDHSAGEIARATGRKEGSVWMALVRIRQALRACLHLKLGVPT